MSSSGIPFLFHIEIGSQRHDSNPLKLLQIQQLAIPGDDEVRAPGDRAFEDAIVWIVFQ